MAAAPQPRAHPCSCTGRNQGSGVRGGGDGKKGTERRPPVAIGPGCGPGCSFPLFHLVMTVATVCVPRVASVPLSLRCVISSSRLPWKTGGGPSLSSVGPGCCLVCVEGHPCHRPWDPEDGGSPWGWGIFPPFSWTSTVTLLLNPGGPWLLGAPDSPTPFSPEVSPTPCARPCLLGSYAAALSQA